MKLLVIYLYFAEPKGSGPATMRILSYIDFHNQLYGHLKKKKKFLKIYQFLLKEMCSVHFEIHICTIDLSNINQYPNYLILKL